MRKIIVILIISFALTISCISPVNSENHFRKRFKQAKESIVLILVNNIPAGTGFSVAPGIIATNFHVVQQFSVGNEGQTQIGYAQNIKVQLSDKREFIAIPHQSVVGPGTIEAVGKDITLLTIPFKDLRPVKLGRFNEIEEGDAIYLIGFPLGIEQPVIASGILSTKWKTSGYLGQGGDRDVAWLDVTMNKGNSGGPVFLIRDNFEQDVVIGVANFMLNPFAHDADEFAKIAAAFPGNAILIGIDFKKFSTLIGKALSSQTHGVGGCISIDTLHLP